MKQLFFYAFLIFGIFIYQNLYSQNNYPKETVQLESDIWLGLNVQISPNQWNDNTNLDSNFVSKNAFFIQVLGKHTTIGTTDTDFFYQKSLYLSYERLLSQKWVGGLSYRYSQVNINTNTLRLHLRHFSPIKKIDLTLWQQLAFERILSNNSFYKPVSRLRFQFAANKYFTISNKKLIGTLSFELFKEIQKINSNSERRFFQEHRLQTEWFFPIYKNIYLGAFAGFHTQQFIALAQFDMDGEELKPTRRLNQQTPVFGISATFTFGKNNIPNKRLWIE
ncbi:hypothetical protein [Bernardetia sp.]|uniref:hypothetical protein n=1 Tax=Bernardetia sp. TaxID=1937974 RepID=UPI0025C67022|nr:hypothetical protein [Bernardetia sp.]